MARHSFDVAISSPLPMNVLQEVSKAKRRKRYQRRTRITTCGSFFIATTVLQCIIVNRTIASFIPPRIVSLRRQHTCIRFAQLKDEDTIIIRQKLEHEIENDDDSSSIEREISPLLSSIAASDDIDIEDDDHISIIEESSIETAKHDDTTYNDEINNDEIIEENEQQNNKLSPQTSTSNINQQDDDDEESFNQYNVINNLESASKRLLNELEITSSTYTTRQHTNSYSSLAKLSKAHHSMLSKSSNMRRQRFVTGKYPLYISVLQNPTNKWLGLASSQIYLNGTSIDKSLASTNIYNWLNNNERINLVDEYELLNIELLAEIYVKKPGYVNILPKGGAGRSLISSQEGNNEDNKPFWKSWKTRRREDDLIKSKLDELDNQDDVDENNKERLWVTGFSLTKSRGEMHTVDVESGKVSYVNDRTRKAILWPNEVTSIPKQVYPNQKKTNPNQTNTMKEDIEIEYEDALLVTDGFLVPGKDNGGLYVVKNPGNSISEEQICLTGEVQSQNWFYHRAIWMDITGDGRQSILAARAKFPLMKSNSNGSGSGGRVNQQQDDKGTSRSMGKGQGQLVWLERPQPHSFCANTGTPLDADGTIFDPFSIKNTPWKLRILDEGPDVMFSVADLDPSDDTIEIIASQFFSKKLSLHSLRIGCDPRIVFRRTIDDRCGAAFSSLLADLDGLATTTTSSGQQNLNQPRVVDSGSTVVSLQKGDAFSHLLVTSHECSYVDETDTNTKNTIENQSSSISAPSYGSSTTTNGQSKIDGGSLFGYRIPSGKDAWKTKPWQRSIIATGFKVDSQLNNMINPGAPGFCYTFFPTRDGGTKNNNKKWSRPLIGISGDCAESAYILRPIQESGRSSYIRDGGSIDKSTNYALMCEIKCKSTVGSLAIGYDDLYSEEAEQQSGYAKIYIPCYEQDKILVFSMGSGEEEYIDEDDGW